MKRDDLITVIIPVYNVEPYLERCMQSVLNQSYGKLEIILVDDVSKDRSNELCMTYLKDERVVVKHGTNEGLSGARNTGLDIAHGKYVIFVDSDDYIELDMIENLYTCMIESGSDTVIGGFRRVIGDRIEIRKNQFSGHVFNTKKDIENNVLKKMLASDGKDQIEMSVWKVMFSMDIIQQNKLRFPDKKYLCEDIIFDFAYYPLSNKLAMSDDTGYCYCLNGESLSQMFQKNKFDRISFQTSEMRKLAKNIGFDEEAYIRIDNFYIGNLIHHLKTMAACSREIGTINCILECKKICNDNGVRRARWNQISCCYSGRDKIPFLLMRKRWGTILFIYLKILTQVRKLVRE